MPATMYNTMQPEAPVVQHSTPTWIPILALCGIGAVVGSVVFKVSPATYASELRAALPHSSAVRSPALRTLGGTRWIKSPVGSVGEQGYPALPLNQALSSTRMVGSVAPAAQPASLQLPTLVAASMIGMAVAAFAWLRRRPAAAYNAGMGPSPVAMVAVSGERHVEDRDIKHSGVL